MPTLDEIRVAIAEKIFNLDPSVAVHQYERYTKNASDLVAMYKSGSDGDARLHGWHVRRFATREELVAVGEWSIWHSWRIRGFMSLDDADESEKLFDTEIEAIRDSFREDETLGGLVLENIAPSGEAGSVGVYALHVDASKALEAMGEAWDFIVADDSPYKAEGAPTGPLTPDARADRQKMVNRYMSMFVRDLARGRGVTMDHVRENFGRGRMLSPQDAVAVKMADRVGTFDDAVRRAAQLGQEKRKRREMERGMSAGPRTPQAGITSAPDLREGGEERSCMNCQYYSKPSADHDGGSCSRHDFHTMDMWLCDDWEARGGEMADDDEGMVAHGPTPEQLAALGRLRL